MDLLAALSERLGLDPADVAGLAVALLGAALATVVALRLPLGLVPAAGDPAVPAPATEGTPATPTSAAPAATATEPGGAGAVGGDVVVHVAGAVAAPGVVVLPAGARVGDAVAAAGGPAPGARLEGLNLARTLVDGEQVVVPDAAALAAPGGAPAAAGGTGGQPPAAVLPDGRLDLNRADAAALEELPGIGEVTAGRILAWRDEHGPFTEPAQLREVHGIGEATWVGLRDMVGVG